MASSQVRNPAASDSTGVDTGPSNTSQPPVDDGPPRIAVKLNADTQEKAKREPGVIASLLEKAFPGSGHDLTIKPLITSVEAKVVASLVARAAELDSEYKPVDFGAWYQVQLDSGDSAGEIPEEAGRFNPKKPGDVANLIRRLNTISGIESANSLRAAPPPVSPGDDPLSVDEGYIDPAPGGIDARYAWNFAGGDGKGIGFVDMEQGWDLTHEDLAGANITLISGTNSFYFFHGTGVLGEVLMTDNTIGGIGIAPSCTGRVVSQIQPGGNNIPAAILSAVAVMEFGDVLLLEAQEYDPVDNSTLLPVEVLDANYDAIRLATALGIIVVEAGCNGSFNLDSYKSLSNLQIFNRSSSDFRDSGAIMVGAGSSTTPHTRLSFSNYGSRIDVYGWGENVETATTDAAGTDNTSYTSTFNGTSSASPIVAGAAILVQGIAQARADRPSPNFRFSPLDMRQLLTENGTQSATPATDLIGVMPNLRAIIDGSFINIAPDIYIRDFMGDIGDANSGAFSASPDIIVLQNPVANPQASFGEGSGTENNNSLSQDVLSGQDQSIYIRLLNRGGSDAANVTVTVYYAQPTTLMTPNVWNLIGTTTVASVPAGNILTVSNTLTWPAAAIPGPGHYCFVALASTPLDPAPLTPASFPTFTAYEQFISNNNNVAWRNFNVIPAPPSEGGFHNFPILIPGAFDAPHRFTIEALGSLPGDSLVELRIPVSLARQLKIRLQDGQIQDGVAVIPLSPFSRQRIGTGEIEKGGKASCEVRIQVPKSTYTKAGVYEFAIRQLDGEKEVGRLTWHFGQPEPVERCCHDVGGGKGEKVKCRHGRVIWHH